MLIAALRRLLSAPYYKNVSPKSCRVRDLSEWRQVDRPKRFKRWRPMATRDPDLSEHEVEAELAPLRRAVHEQVSRYLAHGSPAESPILSGHVAIGGR